MGTDKKKQLKKLPGYIHEFLPNEEATNAKTLWVCTKIALIESQVFIFV